MMLGAYAAWYFADTVGLPYPLAVLAAVGVTAAAGLAADQALFRFTRNNLVNGLLVSIGMIAVLESIALLYFTSTPKELHRVLPGVFSVAGIVVPKIKVGVFALLFAAIVGT